MDASSISLESYDDCPDENPESFEQELWIRLRTFCFFWCSVNGTEAVLRRWNFSDFEMRKLYLACVRSKVDDPKDWKWTVQNEKMDGLKEGNWTVMTTESRRSKKLEVDGPKGSKRMIQKTESGRPKRKTGRSKGRKLDDHECPVWHFWPSILRTVHFHRFGTSTLDQTPERALNWTCFWSYLTIKLTLLEILKFKSHSFAWTASISSRLLSVWQHSIAISSNDITEALCPLWLISFRESSKTDRLSWFWAVSWSLTVSSSKVFNLKAIWIMKMPSE